MEFSTLFNDSGAFLTRFLHVFVGIIWIGLLYYFNFVQMPFFAETEAPVRSGAIQKLVPRALKWFAWGATFTLITGLYLIYRNAAGNMGGYFTSAQGAIISVGASFATLMFLNVMIAILPNQKIVIASTTAVAKGGQADPRQAASASAAAVASRTNALFSIPMLMAMVGTSHLPARSAGISGMFFAIMFGIMLIGEANVFYFKKLVAPLKTPTNTIVSGFVLAAVFFATMVFCF